jgi:hypothetical protein
MNSRYIFQTYMLTALGVPSATHIDPPEGYRLHSWRHQCVTGTIVDSVVRVVWEREPNPASNALAHIPTEWAAPTVEFIKRWILKQQ